jgi:hypothetical protein
MFAIHLSMVSLRSIVSMFFAITSSYQKRKAHLCQAFRFLLRFFADILLCCLDGERQFFRFFHRDLVAARSNAAEKTDQLTAELLWQLQ